MKKGIVLLLVTAFLLMAIVPAGSAVTLSKTKLRAISGGTIQVGTASGKPGDTVTVPVSITGNPGFAGFTLEVSFPNELQLTKVAKGTLLKESEGGALTVNTAKGLINWNDTENLIGDGQLLVLTFKILETAAGEDYAISLALKDNKPSNMVNEDGTPIAFTYVPGKVTVQEAPHTHSYIAVVTAPTCTEQGYTTHTCACGDSYVDTYVDSLGHDWGDWVLTTVPTETTPGEETRTCARCSATETREPGTTTGSIQVGTATGKPGNEVTVSVDITNNPGFAGFTLEAAFPTELQLKKVLKGDLLKESEGGALTTNISKGLINWNDTANLIGDGQLLVLTFDISSDAADGDYAVSLMIKEGKPSNFVNENGKPISVTFLPGKVTVQRHVHEYVDVVTAPTCTEQGYTTHTCSCGDSFVDTYVDALGHDWDTPSYVWADDCSTVTASRTCKRVASHIETETANTTSVVSSAATCTAQGKTTYTAVFLNTAFCEQTKTVANIPALGHNYELTGWDWTGYTAATATFTCKNDANHVQTVNATITNVRTEPTCTASGKIEYTAKVSFEGKEYTDTKTQTLDETGHSYELTGWNWTGYTAATATFTCKNDATHVETANAVITNVRTEPTCEEDGKIVYTATVAFNGKTYTDTKTQTLAATGHDYELTGWNWTGCTAATATFTCRNDSAHVQMVNAKITAVRTEPTCESAGQVVYTATITFEGKTFTDKKTETLAALGHDWNEPTYTWAADCSTATAARTCKRDASHTETETVTTSAKVTKPATCVEKGETTYTASFKNPAFAMQSKTVENIAALGHTPGEPVKENEIAATCTEQGGYDMVTYCTVCGTKLSREHTTTDAIGHNYELTGWNWTGYTAAEAVFTCRNDASHVETVSAVITSVRTEPTTEKEGSVVYTATAVFEGKTYTDTKTEILPALGKEYELTGWVWDGYTAATATFTEKTDGSTVTVQATITVARTEPACTVSGTAIYTASVIFDEKEYTDTKTETLPALGHTPGEPVKENEIAATCTEQGGYDMVTYCTVCRVELGREHTTTEAIGHAYELTGWNWTGYAAAEAVFTCKNDASHVETVSAVIASERTEPTTENDGSVVYTASAVFEGKTYTDTRTEILPALGKEYELTVWTWDGYSAATATFTEKTDGSTVTVQATITVARTEPTCTEDGTAIYTASVTFDEKDYTDTKTETLPALGHTPGEAVKENETAPTCTEQGGYDMATYCTVCGTELSRMHTATDALGHEPGEAVKENETAATCTEQGGYDMATYCTVCGAELRREHTTTNAIGHKPGEAVKENENAPTCTEQGGYDMVTYCTVCGTELSREHSEIAAFGHDWNEPTYTWADDCSTVTATRTCKNDGSHVETEKVNTTSKVTKEATYEQEGEIVYTATFTNEAFTTQTKTITTPKLTKPDDGLPCDGGNSCPGKVFTDMPPKSNWAHDAIDWAIVNEITAGTSPTTFSPSAGCTRAQVVTFLWRAAGEPQPTTASNPFRDVKSDAYYYNAVLWAVGEGITTGTSATTFSPDATCTRGQIVAFLWRYHGSPEPASASNPFVDVKTADYYYNAVLWASVYGVTAGTSATTFSPNNTCTRDQVVTFLYRSNSYAGEMGAFVESRYEIVVDTCTWEEAQAAAAAKGGKLVTFEDQYEYQYVLNLIARKGDKNAYYHIGGRREDDSTTYYWVDKDNKPVGSALNGTTAWWNGIWETGDPNFAWEGEPETVMILYYSKTEARWCWYDGWATALTAGRQYAYIIEYD